MSLQVKTSIGNLNGFLIFFNNLFPRDRWWRKKYKVALFSKEHLQANQVSIYLEWLEDRVFEQQMKESISWSEKYKKYKEEGEWFCYFMDEAEESKAFDDLDISNL